MATLGLMKARLATNLAEDLRRVDESANARGVYNSGIRTTDRARTGLDYERREQDLATDTAQALRQIALGESGARSNFQTGLAELLLQLANSAAQDERTPSAGGGAPRNNGKPKGGKNKGGKNKKGGKPPTKKGGK